MVNFALSRLLLLVLCIVILTNARSQTVTNKVIPTGSFIVNMGIIPQTPNNALKPYGMLYALLQAKCPVHWVINPTKIKDGVDFTYNGVNYSGAPFIIEASYRTPAINSIISTWQALGVIGLTTTSQITVPVYLTFTNVPHWTLDLQNGSIAVNFFNNAGFTGQAATDAYGGTSKSGWKTPAQLNCCDDILVMPHADPIWSTHSNLFNWVTSGGCKGGIWLGCHAGSALMDMFNNVTPNLNQQTNFLVNKSGPAIGAGPYYENALLLWGSHSDGTPPYSYNYSGEPIMQFMGTIDAAQLNGSEQIYIPKGSSGGWFPGTHVGVFDPDHLQRFNSNEEYKAATLAYGPAFGIDGNGLIMMEAAHNISGTNTANVAAQRAFFNFSYLVAWQKSVSPVMAALPTTMFSGQSYPLSFTTIANVPPGPAQNYTTTWLSSCGGSFLPSNTSPNPTFIPPSASSGPLQCNITLTIADECGRTTFENKTVTIQCALGVTKTIAPVSCNGSNNGSISITNISGGTAPYNWSYSRTSPSSGTGSGTSSSFPINITGLIAGTYNFTITDAGGCSDVSTIQIMEPSPLVATISATNISCFNANNGNINLSVSGGTAPYIFNWSDLPASSDPEDRTSLSPGNYSVIITDSKGCQTNASVIITQPSSLLAVTGVITNITCNGSNNGQINITTSGGTIPYTYDWSDIAGNSDAEDKTGLVPGNYTVIVTDANGCTATQAFAITQPQILAISAVITQPLCPPNSQLNANNGSLNITVSGGTSAYSFTWIASGTGSIPPGQINNEDLTSLVAGIYNVTVIDNKGCTALKSFTIVNQNPNPATPGTIIKN
jgi:hypothetical protein